MNKEEELDRLINDLRKVDARLQFLMERGSNDEKLVDKKRKLTNEIKKIKGGL